MTQTPLPAMLSAQPPEVVARRSAAPLRAFAGRVGEALGEWRLVQLISRGPLFQVYRAQPAAADGAAAAYALKVVSPDTNQPLAASDMLRREAAVARDVVHPHLVAVLGAQVAEAPEYIVTPWLSGATVERHLRFRPMPVAVALWIVRQTAEALAALDAAGWMHGDVKPANIIVSVTGHATLVDLGFARRPGEIASAVDRAVVGTAAYMAPEVITSALRPDIRSDIYSLGVTLFEMLSGRRPYRGGGLAEMARQHRQESPLDLKTLVPALPPDVRHLVHEMMANEPLRRPQTARELVARLVALEIALLGES